MLKRMNIKNKFVSILFILLTINTFLYAQGGYKWQAKVQPVDNPAYYQLYLSPEITSRLKHSFPDIRLYNEKNNEVQYILNQVKNIYGKGKKHKLKILKNKYRKFKHYTEILLENEDNAEISNLIFRVVNTNNPVFLKILGSSDSKNWYILKNNYPVVPEITNADTTDIKLLNMPASDFKFYKVLFHDYDEQRISVSSVYYYSRSDITAEYTELPKPVLTQKDTLDKSIVTIEFADAQFIDMMTFGIQGPEFYLRKVQLLKSDTGMVNANGEEYYDQKTKKLWFGSLKSNRLVLSDFKAKKIELIIDNKDNQPLKIFKVNAYQLKNYMVAYLLPDTKYHLLFGNKNANFASYDLPYFKDTIPKILPETYIYAISKNKDSGAKVNIIWDFPLKHLWLFVGSFAFLLMLISIFLLIRIIKNNRK